MKHIRKQKRIWCHILAVGILFSSCVTETMIISKPKDAKLYLDDEYVGNTPYRHKTKKMATTCVDVKIKKEGYEDLNTKICRDEEYNMGAIVGAFFCTIPVLWALDYKPVHKYELTPDQTLQSKTKTDKLQELNELLEKGLIKEDEYEREKQKILEE